VRRSIHLKLPRNPRLVSVTLVVALAATAAFVGLSRPAGAASAAAPNNTSPPTISGTAQEGQTLKASPGTWSGSTPMDFSYQWRRCGTGGGNCRNISKATDNIYTLTSDDVGHRLRVLVTAVNSDGAGTAQSKATDIVKAAPPQAPKNTTEPSISGTAQQGQTLTANPGEWSGNKPIQFAYRWRRCDAKGGDCSNTSLTSQTYLLGATEVGHTLRVLVTASNSVGSSAAISNATSVVTSSGTPSGQCHPVTQVSLPERLVVDKITYSPSQIRSRSVPLVARFHVISTKGYCVSGATVLGLGVPFNRLSEPGEVTTDATGWAQISFQVLPTFQLRHGNLVVIFVRARKPGDSILAGVSTRRLVSVRVA
jgi:hypothetical protein